MFTHNQMWRLVAETRCGRGSEYKILISNPDGREKGVREVRLDGRTLEANLLPIPTAKGLRHKVEVVMG